MPGKQVVGEVIPAVRGIGGVPVRSYARMLKTLWADTALVGSLPGFLTPAVYYSGIKSCLAAQEGSRWSLPTQATSPHQRTFPAPPMGLQASWGQGPGRQDGRPWPGSEAFLRAGGPSDGLVRDLSYCEANLGRDDFRSGVGSGWCSRPGPGGHEQRIQTTGLKSPVIKQPHRHGY